MDDAPMGGSPRLDQINEALETTINRRVDLEMRLNFVKAKLLAFLAIEKARTSSKEEVK